MGVDINITIDKMLMLALQKKETLDKNADLVFKENKIQLDFLS